MESLPIKQAITLALDTMGMQGRFSTRDVAEKAYTEGARYDGLSLADQRDTMINFLMAEARHQMKAPLREELKKEVIDRLPEAHWGLIERLTKTICVNTGRTPCHVFTLYATEEDWSGFVTVANQMTDNLKVARNSGRNIRDLLRKEGVSTLNELMINGSK